MVSNYINEYIKYLPHRQPDPEERRNGIFLDRGELPYPPSPRVIAAISEAATKSNRYPEILDSSLREALSNYVGVPVNQILVGNGSDDLIELIVKVFVKSNDEVLLPIPTFFVYLHSTQILGASTVLVKRQDNFDIDVASLIEQVSPRTKIIFIANPNNPTGNLTSKRDIIEILSSVKCPVVVDECYYEICGSTLLELVEKYSNLIILRSFSKSFGLAGLRIGYCIASEEIIGYMSRAAQVYSVGRVAVAAAVAALEDLEYMRANIKILCEQRSKISQSLQKLGFIVYPSSTNFLFINSEPLGITSEELTTLLFNKKIFIANFGNKQGLDNFYLRISCGTPVENDLLLSEFSRIIRR
jgi:histidinol-phosphate aminotransferase